MAKDDDLRGFLERRLGEIHGDVKAISATQIAHKDYLDAVSQKAGRAQDRAEAAEKAADAALDAHKGDLAAHGAGAVAKAIGLLGGLAALGGALWKGFTVLGHKG